MAWLYVPNCGPSPSVPGSEDLTLASAWRCRTLARSATWRGKPLPPRAWSRQWKRGGFIRLLSGLTCEPSTLDLGVASFISSLRAIPARTTALPESGPVPMGQGSSPPRSAALPPSAGLMLSSERTCRGTRVDNSKPSSRHWSDWATALRQEYSVRPKPATPCGASDCSSWPSPMAGAAGTEDYNAAGNSDFSRKEMELAEAMLAQARPAPRSSDTNGAGAHGDGGMDLRTMASEWEAPSVAVVDGTRLTRGGERSNELLLTGQAVQASLNWSGPRATDGEKGGPNMSFGAGGTPLPAQAVLASEAIQGPAWPGPAARDHKGSSVGSITRQDGKSRADMLDFAAEQFFHPPSSPDQPIAGGSMSSTASPNSNQPSVKRKLNPIFVEALMRWPTGLSGFERQEMGLTLWLLRMRSFLSALCTSVAEADGPEQLTFL